MPAFSDEIQKKCGDIHELKEVAIDSPSLALGTTPNTCPSRAFFAALFKVESRLPQILTSSRRRRRLLAPSGCCSVPQRDADGGRQVRVLLGDCHGRLQDP